jgi:hypothetical protein
MFKAEIVYKVPGKNAGPEGKTYDWVKVVSQEDYKQRLNDGWFDTLAEALKGTVTASSDTTIVGEPVRAREDDGTYRGDDPSTPDVNEAYADNAPPTRKELKEKADELGIKYPKNIKDAKLRRLIEVKLKD